MVKPGNKNSGCSRAVSFSKSVEICGPSGAASEPTPGPSREPQRAKSLAKGIKQTKSAEARDSKNMKKLELMVNSLKDSKQVQLKTQNEPKQAKWYKLPDAPTSKEKGKGTEPDHRQSACPLLPGVPSIPPPSIPQPSEVLRSHAAAENDGDDVIEGIPPLLTTRTGIYPFFFVDIEHDLASEANSDSEKEEEDRPLLNPRNAVVEDLKEPNPTEAMQLMCLDAEEDQAIRNMAAGDEVLHFDWSSEYTHFEGVREKFTGPSGPTFDHSGMSPLQVFQKIWDTSIIDHIVRATNNYARELQAKNAGKRESRLTRWEDTTREEIWRFLSILMLQSLIVNNVEREYWYPSNDHMRIGNFETLMSHNRFLLIKRCLHFTDNSSLPEHPSKLDNIMPIITHLNKKFGKLYLPEQNVAIDESLLLSKERLSFSQKIATKRARGGLKSFELCESRTGYLWKMEFCSGKGHMQGAAAVEGQEAEDEPENATSQIVFNFIRPLFGKGHTLVLDSYHNSPLLSRILKTKHRTDTMGTLRLNREFVPEGLKAKTKENMKPGEVCFSSTKDLCVVVYRDTNIVAMISTFHKPEVVRNSSRPKVILDYNLSMGGIDHKDQLLSSYPIDRIRNSCWQRRLFLRLINVSILNASVIHDHGRTGSDKLGNRSFRLQLIKEMLETYCDTLRTLRPLQPQPQPQPPALSQMHLPLKCKKTQRCKRCYKNKVKRTTVWSCGTCRVNLCIEGCYTQYHKDLVNDLENQ